MALRLGFSGSLRLQAPAPIQAPPPSPPTPPPPPPPPSSLLVTSEGDALTTEAGDFIVWETN